MRRLPSVLTALALTALAGSGTMLAPEPSVAQGLPPHAWLFGSWTGGLFPVPPHLSAEVCLQQPVVIFTRDLVLRASLTSQLYGQRIIETALTTGTTTDFRFTPAPSPAAGVSGLMALSAPAAATSFGCSDPNGLRVVRKSENEITFPNCADFPNPLVRCGH